VPPAAVTVVTGVQVTLADRNVYAGQFVQASAAPVDREGLPLIADTTLWTSTNPSIATVSARGLVAGITPGTAEIVATADGFVGHATLTVVEAGPPLQWASISAAVAATCGVTTSGAAYCWGSSESAVFNSSPARRGIPTPVAGALRFSSIVSGDHAACGLTAAGVAYCWGSGQQPSQLGRGVAAGPPDTVPAPVSGGLQFKLLSAGSFATTCGLTTSGAAYCWGNGGYGALGNGSDSDSAVPVAVSGGLTFSSVTGGGNFNCGLTVGGAAYCWGRNQGQVGGGSTANATVPVPVPSGLIFTSLSAGREFACGVATGGAVYCWGDESVGELGNGSTAYTYSSVPVLVSGGLRFASVSAGAGRACALTPAGAAYCWGSAADVGALGDGASGDSNVPVPVTGGLSFQSISPGMYHTCAVTVGGAAYCWGDNSFWGELGIGQYFPSSNAPVLVFSPRGWRRQSGRRYTERETSI
jgi:alpha-tubulin suppressor-like RCC1 family protein